MREGRRIAIASLLLCCAASCRKEEPQGSETAPAGPSERIPAATSGVAPRSVATHEHMQEHFDAIVHVRDALIDGNVEAAKAHALWIVEHKSDPGIESWRASIADMEQAAAQVVQATTGEAAAAGAAELARACGHCHASHGMSPELGAAAPPPLAASGPVPHMLRHQWAAERMWEGLIGPSEERWSAGAAELTETPLTSDEIVSHQTVGPWITDLATQVHAIGAEARTVPAGAWDTRSALYGRFLSTCASCHQALPPPRP